MKVIIGNPDYFDLLSKGDVIITTSQDDANPDIGDSAITETFGVGGMAMIAAPSFEFGLMIAHGFSDVKRFFTAWDSLHADL